MSAEALLRMVRKTCAVTLFGGLSLAAHGAPSAQAILEASDAIRNPDNPFA